MQVLLNTKTAVVILILGLALLLTGIFYTAYRSAFRDRVRTAKKAKVQRIIKKLEAGTSFFPLGFLRSRIKRELALILVEDFTIDLVSNLVILALLIASALLIVIMQSIGQLWYVKVMIFCMCAVVPYYTLALCFDLNRYRINRQIPKMIDEFRSSFIKHNKVKPALRECSGYIDKKLGRIMYQASDTTFLEENLNILRDRFENLWFNMFVVLISNYKENGGELIDQLYRLNKTMTSYGNIEKKKNRRLIWYEMFAVSAALLSIPAVLWINGIMFGTDTNFVMDAEANLIISRVIGFSILSLIVIRVLRKY